MIPITLVFNREKTTCFSADFNDGIFAPVFGFILGFQSDIYNFTELIKTCRLPIKQEIHTAVTI